MKTKKILAFILIFSIVLVLIPQLALAADHSVSTPEELTTALGSAGNGDTIRLTADIEYTAGISISGKAITFDLNGHTLNVVNNAGTGLYVGSGGVVSLTGSGALNVATSADDEYGVDAEQGGRATVTNATATSNTGVGAHAIHAGSFVQVTGNATSAHNIGALARNEGTVMVGGNAEGGEIGANAVGLNTLTEVAGDATGGTGVQCALGATVRVHGNVSGTDSAIDALYTGSTVIVGGNVTANGAGAVGAFVYDGCTITIDGTMLAPVYAELQDIQKTAADGIPGTAPYEGYLIYTDGSNTVRVRSLISPVISESNLTFDKNPAINADVSTTITWNNATSVTEVKASGVSIGAGNYSVSGNILTIKKEYLLGLSSDSIALTVEFDIGDPAALTIALGDSTPITGLPDNLMLYVGGRVTWDPSPAGGAWNWDGEYLSADLSSSATFTALKAGTSTVTYTAHGISHSITVTIRETQLPLTGQDSTIIWVLGSLAVLTIIMAFSMVIKRKRRA